ncbi:MAG: uracil-DNA glycosylase [Planctomycetota bacterium]
MTNLLRTGRLEVETDLLLGAEEVLLPEGWTPAAKPADAAVAQAPAAPAGRGGFDSALFEPKPRVAGGAPAPLRAEPPSAFPIARAPDPAPLVQPAAASNPLEDRIKAPAGVDRASRLAALASLHAAECPHCTVAKGHQSLVFGEGSAEAELMFVGEAPGETEDLLGRPFVGRAGEKLDEMIRAMGFRREEVYIANVLKARPPENRTPLAHEVERCGPYLLAQVSVIRPRAIVALSGPAAKLLLASELGITRLRGTFASVTAGRADGEPFTVPVMPTFPPAYLLRNYTVETRAQMWNDLKQVLELLGRELPKRG